MIVVLKPLFEVLTGDVTVLDNVLNNYLIMLVVGELAYRFAWNFVRDLYHTGAIDGKVSGSVIHWIIRFIAYIICAYIIRGGIWLYGLVIAVPQWIWWLMLGILATGTLTIIAIILMRNRKVRSPDDTRIKKAN